DLKKTSWNNKEERIQYGKKLKPFLKTLPNKQRERLYHQLIKSFDDVSVPKNLMLDWDEVSYLSRKGVVIGSHTVSHPLLEKIEIEAEIEEELGKSYEELAQKLTVPLSIAYPVGSYDNRVKKISKKIGYKYGLAVNHISYDQEKHDLFEIPRIDLYTESFLKSKMRINGTLMRVKQLINRA
ncbi:MAG: polysaccharide deacetylase family protein, partial [Bacteroidota bacterium]